MPITTVPPLPHVRDIRMRRFGPDRSTDLSTREIEDETRSWHDHGSGVTDVLLPVAEAEEALSGGESDRDELSNAEAVGSPQREVEENRLPAGVGEEVRDRTGTAEEAPEGPIVLRGSQRERRRPAYLSDYVAS